MKKMLIVLAMVLFVPSLVFAADVSLRWDAVTGATGYKIYVSNDNCATWLAPKDVGNVVTYTYVGVSDTVLVHFKVSAYKTGGVETVTNHFGAWWDSRLMPLGNPVALGVK
jgi:hypothetical protein